MYPTTHITGIQCALRLTFQEFSVDPRHRNGVMMSEVDCEEGVR